MTSRRRGERGATAVLASILAMLLVGVSAFTVDFGRAYTSKRQLQNAADAGSLAGASYYVGKSGSCATLRANSSYTTASKAVASAILQESRPNAVIDSYTVGCNGQGELTVDLSVTGKTPVAFGALYGTNSITTQRQAQSTLEVVELSTRGLRPYMVCSEYAPSTLPSGVIKVDYPSTSDASGNCPHDGGNWFTVDCPHAGNTNNGNPSLAIATAQGCDPSHPVSVVSPQDTSSPENLYSSLIAACPAASNLMANYDPDCLTSNPGNLNASEVLSAWSSLLGKTILLPIFCAKGTVTGRCNPAGWVQGSSAGNQTMYPVHRFASVTVCGYHWGSNAVQLQNSGVYSGTNPACSGADASAGGNNNYLLLVFQQYQFSGSTNDSDCPLNDPTCDGGARQVRLTQ